VVKGLQEKWGCDKLSNYEIEFGECLNQIEVLDLASTSCNFAWNNKRNEGSFVALRN
jgi:hypothetical protein